MKEPAPDATARVPKRFLPVLLTAQWWHWCFSPRLRLEAGFQIRMNGFTNKPIHWNKLWTHSIRAIVNNPQISSAIYHSWQEYGKILTRLPFCNSAKLSVLTFHLSLIAQLAYETEKLLNELYKQNNLLLSSFVRASFFFFLGKKKACKAAGSLVFNSITIT